MARCQELKETRRTREGRRSGGAHHRHSSGGEGSIVSCPAVPSGRFAHQRQYQQQQRVSPAALAALARSPRYTSTLSVGTLHHARSASASSSYSGANHRDLSKSTGNFIGMQLDHASLDKLSPKVRVLHAFLPFSCTSAIRT